jgi:hypothetical protein
MGTVGKCCGGWTMFWGAAVFAVSVALHFIVPSIVRETLKEDLVLTTPASALYGSFVHPSSKVDVYMSYYLFHVSNPYDVMNGAVPKLQQKGPYVYLEDKWRPEANITWHPNATMSYIYKTTYTFVPEKSVGLLDDVITTIDVGLFGALKAATHFGIEGFFLTKLAAASAMINKTSIFMNRTVSDILWGYNDPILDALAVELGPLARLVHLSPFVALQSNESLHTGGALSMCYTGGKASKTQPPAPEDATGVMTMWEGMTLLTYWGDDYANMINGTDGTLFSPNFPLGGSVNAFVDTMYRSVVLTNKNSETKDYKGVELYRLSISDDALLSSTLNPANAAFYLDITGFQPAPPSLSAPVWFSKPFYLDANRSVVNIDWTTLGFPVGGPSDRDLRSTYDTFLDVEPHTGQLFEVHKRIQANAHIGVIEADLPSGAHFALEWTRNIQSTFLPIFWADEHTKMPENLVEDLKKQVLLPMRLGRYGGIAGAALGSVLLIVGLICLARCGGRDEKDSLRHESDYLINAR